MSTPERSRPPLEVPDTAGEHELAPTPDDAPEPERRAARSKPAGSSSSRASSSSSSKRKPRVDRRPHSTQRAATTRAMLGKGVSDTVNGLAFAVSMIDAEDGAIIAQGEPRLTEAVLTTADQNPRFRAWLEQALKGGSYLQLVAAVGAIVLPITLRHFPMPAQFRLAADLAGGGGMVAPDSVPAEWVPVEPFQDESGRWYGTAPDGTLIPLAEPPNGNGA